jgi:hypothetical protein
MTPFGDAFVAATFDRYPADVRQRLLDLRELIFAVARATPGVGPLQERLRWGQPSYLTVESKTGSTIRISAVPSSPGSYAMYFHCQTTLIEGFKARFDGLFKYEGTRALVFSVSDRLPRSKLGECVRDALTYHLKRRKVRGPIGRLIR